MSLRYIHYQGNERKIIYLLLASTCMLPFLSLYKLPFTLFMGSGWATTCYIVFLILFAAPFCFLQYSRAAKSRCCILKDFQQHCVVFNVGAYTGLFNNVFTMIINGVFLTYSVAFIVFSSYQCDGKKCTSSNFIWGSCHDKWSEGDCKESYELVYMGPIAEEKFLLNYVLQRPDSIYPEQGFARWFGIDGYVCGIHIILLLVVLLLTYSGERIFFYLLVVLAPVSVVLLSIILILFGVLYADASGQLSEFLRTFLTNFATTIPIERYSRDQFHIQPLIWGFNIMFVQLSQVFQLWSGVYPVLGKWFSGTGVRFHSSWVAMLVLWALLVPMPVLTMIFATASSFHPSYIRCHLGTGWISPFIIIPHVFAKFSTHRALAVCFFITISLFLLMHQSFLLLVTTTNIMELCIPSEVPEKTAQRYSRLFLIFLSSVIALLGLPMLQRTGFYWIRLMDAYADRLILLSMIFQSIGYLVLHVRDKQSKPIQYIAILVFYGTIISITTVIYSWYAFATDHLPPTDSLCSTYTQAPKDDPIKNQYRYLGKIIAVSPFTLGFIITIATALWKKDRTNQSFWKILFKGTSETGNTRTKGYTVAKREQPGDEPGMYHFAMRNL